MKIPYLIIMGLVMRIVMIIGISIGYLYNTVRGILLISKSIVFSPTQKVVHSIFTVIVPFFWFYILKDLLTVETPVVTKEIREKRRKENYSQFYEGGFYG